MRDSIKSDHLFLSNNRFSKKCLYKVKVSRWGISVVVKSVARAVYFYLSFIMEVSSSSDNQFRDIIVRIVDLLQLSNTAIWRRCDFEWRRRLRRMARVQLKRVFRWLLSCCTIREIVRLHQLIFHGNELAVTTAGEFILLRNLHQTYILQPIMNEYDEYVGKYSNM